MNKKSMVIIICLIIASLAIVFYVYNSGNNITGKALVEDDERVTDCVDSDGSNYLTKGSVTYNLEGESITKYDVCSTKLDEIEETETSQYLMERKCTSQYYFVESKSCNAGDCPGCVCYDGACVEVVNGDGKCMYGETCETTPEDCGTCPSCGNGKVEGSEECDDGNTVTETACAYGDDGNTVTETACAYGEESCTLCSATCTNVTGTITSYCGDDECDEANENHGNCPEDCNETCNNTICDEWENCLTCPKDCACEDGKICQLNGSCAEDPNPLSWKNTTKITNTQFKLGYTTNISKNERIQVKIGTSNHHIGIINITLDKVTIRVESTPQLATLSIGEEEKFDTNSDEYYDISVKLNSITGDKAEITIKSISEEINPGETGNGNGNGGNENEGEEECDYYHLELCNDESSCIDANGYWYDSTCNENSQNEFYEEESDKLKPWIILIIITIVTAIFVIIIFLLTYKNMKKKQQT